MFTFRRDFFFPIVADYNDEPQCHYNVVKDDEENYTIEINAVGLLKRNIKIETKKNTICVSYIGIDKGLREWHDGNFRKIWELDEGMIVENAKLRDGLLTIKIKKIIPESEVGKIIQIE